MTWVVKAACVVAKESSETGEAYYYRNAILPAGVERSEITRLSSMGLIEEKISEPAITVTAKK